MNDPAWTILFHHDLKIDSVIGMRRNTGGIIMITDTGETVIHQRGQRVPKDTEVMREKTVERGDQVEKNM